MNKAELIATVAEKTGLSKKDSEKAVNATQLYGTLCTEIRTADAHNDQRLCSAADAGCGGEDLLELSVLHVPRQIEPSGEILTGTRVLEQRAVRLCSCCVVRPCGVKKSGRAGEIHFDHCDTFSLKGYHQYTR